MTKQLLSEVLREALEFSESRKSLLLSTVDSDGLPHASYAPFVRNASGDFYILVSELSSHTEFLARGNASILLIEDESDASQIFARTRVSFHCTVQFVERHSEVWSEKVDAMQLRHGAIIETLVSLADFRMCRLIPDNGRYVRGFGQAYNIDPAFSTIDHIDKDDLK